MGPTRAQFIQYTPAALAVVPLVAGPWSALAAAAAGAGAWAVNTSAPVLRSLIACGFTATGCGIAANEVLAAGGNPLIALGLAVPAGAAALAHHRNIAGHLPAAALTPATTGTSAAGGLTSQAQLITAWWKEFISGPTQTEDRKLIQPGANLEHLALEADDDHVAFTGIITLPQGQQVRVRAADIAAVYQIPVSQVEMGDPKHYAPNALPVTVHLKVPAVQPQIAAGTPTTPAEMWAAYVGVPEGAMPGTTLTVTRYDGPLDWEGIATRDRRAIGTVNLQDLAGNLDLETIQIALAPGDKPSQMGIRVMREHALMHGTMLSSVLDELPMDSRGYVRAGTYVDGRAALLPLAQPGSGARHLYLVGGSRSGKSGLLEQILLSAHRSGIAVILASPQAGTIAGASLSAYLGDGLDEAMGALRLAYAMMLDREARYRSPAFPFTDPLVLVVIDEAHMLLSASSPYHLEAKAIVEQLTRRSLKRGIGVVLATQTPLAEDLGNSTVIRSQLLIGGGAVFLRCARGQGSLVGANAVEGAEGIDLSMIPSQWPGQYAKVADRDMSGLATEAAAAPEDGTFGLGYLLTPGSQAVQFRSLHLNVAPASLAGGEQPVGIEDCDAWRERDAITQTPMVDRRGKNLIGSLADLLAAAEGAPSSQEAPHHPGGPQPTAGPSRPGAPGAAAGAPDGQELIKPRIIELLREQSIPMTAETIARKLGTSAKNIKPRLSELKKRDEVTNENGLWRAA
ncbi:type IV secretory system conjugative DNA transfer family protein (plasmid) [Streptomyces sp. Qhu-G9]|uniref:type IV secretory system conjugative DNA transfer family protein n=1 Tax=Streptomyces sp. Qhu-G9 TaxID=3452799 RepID=UPI0022ABC6F4|nr:type IV secretory system conjugative DNA transfer family protein [Streptomyces aurantiacus]WAU78331.1 type IV secretory system conjugative DNA transfer family protein [Streptomyces aurantiacus]